MNRHAAEHWRRRFALSLAGMLAVACSTAAILPAGLYSPDHGVVCDGLRAACFDRFGPSIGLTEVYLGQGAAQALTAALRKAPADHSPGAEFSPGDNIACRRETGPCRIGAVVHEALTAVLYGARTAESRGAQASAVTGVDWQWNISRYNNDTEARPSDPARYRLRLEPDGSLRARVDCNQAGGRYRIEGSAIAIELTHATMAACEPGSLDQVFQRDLGAAALYFVRQGRLYLDLRNHTGTMEFGRR
jgi:heat shock protein HslJ